MKLYVTCEICEKEQMVTPGKTQTCNACRVIILSSPYPLEDDPTLNNVRRLKSRRTDY